MFVKVHCRCDGDGYMVFEIRETPSKVVDSLCS